MVKPKRVYCNGRNDQGYIEHPGVYLDVENENYNEILCNYCYRTLTIKDSSDKTTIDETS